MNKQDFNYLAELLVIALVNEGVSENTAKRVVETARKLPFSEPGINGTVFIDHYGTNKIATIKVIRQHTGLGLKEAKEMAETPGSAWTLPRAEAQKFKADLETAGANTRLE